MNRTERALAALLISLSVWVSGCAAVAPWERGNLAKPHMALEPNPAQRAMREHTYMSREAAIGGEAGGGGGCGCY
ncbi:MAG: DUF4266 domain-containing protein [Gammaproteobacteria bacterium]